ncbi:MAG: AAA family ATPase [Rhodospirillaceae bacterium]|nr:AAA family ATPase [Rhodospirillaceae bacterium]
MDALILRNFRCFGDPGKVPLKPLTLLIGENSTGKTSFLAAVRLASDISYSGRTIDFNERPFQLGSFNEIAHYKGGRAGRAQTFEIAFESLVRRHGRRPHKAGREGGSPSLRSMRHSAVFRRSGSHPVIASQSLKFGEHQITVSSQPSADQPALEYRLGDSTETIPLQNLPIPSPAEAAFDWHYALYVTMDGPRIQRKKGAANNKLSTRPAFREVVQIAAGTMWRGRPICIAPVRTTPLRTYDPVSDTPVPEGAHIPMVLAKLFFQEKDEWKSLKDTLDRFGKESGLFTGVYIKALGRYESDPFQIRVGIKGPQANLVDVGYGVSQALPILVEALRSDSGAVHLMQQPEVHMHPRSQAALGSFLAGLAANQEKQFIVETHSDYLVDRVRMDIRDGKSITPDDVVLLYFERQGSEIVIHPITIDSAGNLVGEPDTYRSFFLTEERRFLGL